MENQLQADRDLDLTVGDRTQVSRSALAAAGQIKIFRSRDYAAIRALCVHPKIFPLIADDFHADPKAWRVPENEEIVYLLASDDEGPFGFGIFHPINMACWAGHFGFLPRGYGGDARTSFTRMLSWVWENTAAQKVVGEIVRENVLATRFARSVGFALYGVNKKSFLRGGVLRDQLCFGIMKPSASEEENRARSRS